MSINSATKTMDSSSTGVLTEYKPQRADDVRPCPRCLNQSSHSADRCPLRPLPSAVGHNITVTTRPSPGGTATTTVTTRPGTGGTTTTTVTSQIDHLGITTSVNILGGHHIWYYSGAGATVAIETPTAASETRNNPNCRRRRRKRPNKATRRARIAAQQTNSLDPTPPAAKTEDTDEDMIE